MPDYKAPLEDIRFLLHDVFKLTSFCSEFSQLDEIDRDMVDAILTEAAKVCEQILAPIDRVGDQVGCSWRGGEVTTAEGFKDAYKDFCEGGWGALGGDPAYGGMGMPKALVSTIEELVQGANIAFGLAPMLTAGACLSLLAHGSEELKSLYLPKMYSGKWSGAMDLTEAHAGTDLGLMRTKAIPCDDGSYALSGSKIFITWGEHDMAENIVHLVLAKLPDAPSGSRGISLFLVPKRLPNGDGSVGEFNQLSCGSIEHKMGIHGSPTCVMNFDGAKGWLIGKPHEGLACMFTMMNYERLVVGIQGVGVAENAYQCARDYALDRLQGRCASGAVNIDKPADPIIVHADIRRMLLEVKAVNEAGRAFYVYLAKCLDRTKFSDSAKDRAVADRRVSLLTPVLKAFLTDTSFEACVKAQQVLGGHGYVQEWGQEQHVRDARITQIYEGTNGIQAMDLIGRKTFSCKAKLLDDYITEMRTELNARSESLPEYAIDGFTRVLSLLEELTGDMLKQSSPEYPGAVAVDYLHLLGYCSYAYMWVLMLSELAVSSELSPDRASSKEKTGQFFFTKILPNAASLAVKIRAGDEVIASISPSEF